MHERRDCAVLSTGSTTNCGPLLPLPVCGLLVGAGGIRCAGWVSWMNSCESLRSFAVGGLTGRKQARLLAVHGLRKLEMPNISLTVRVLQVGAGVMMSGWAHGAEREPGKLDERL